MNSYSEDGVFTRSPRRRLAAAMPLGSVWTAHSTLGHLRPGPMRLVAFRSSYMEFDAGGRYLTRIGYPPLTGLKISDDCRQIAMAENGFVSVYRRSDAATEAMETSTAEHRRDLRNPRCVDRAVQDRWMPVPARSASNSDTVQTSLNIGTIG